MHLVRRGKVCRMKLSRADDMSSALPLSDHVPHGGCEVGLLCPLRSSFLQASYCGITSLFSVTLVFKGHFDFLHSAFHVTQLMYMIGYIYLPLYTCEKCLFILSFSQSATFKQSVHISHKRNVLNICL